MDTGGFHELLLCNAKIIILVLAHFAIICVALLNNERRFLNSDCKVYALFFTTTKVCRLRY